MIFGKTKKRLDKIEETQKLIVGVLDEMKTIHQNQLHVARTISKQAFFAARISYSMSFVIEKILEEKPLEASDRKYLFERIREVRSEYDKSLDEGEGEGEVDGRDN